MNDFAMFQHAAAILDGGQPVALVTVVRTTGSTPARVGYKMLVCDGGRTTVGTVGGGLSEARMIEEAARVLGEPSSRSFGCDLAGTTEDEEGICGGSVEFLIESFDETALPLFQELSAAAGSHEASLLVSIIAPGGPPRKLHWRSAGHIGGLHAGLSAEVAEAIRQAVTSQEAAVRASAGEMDVFIERLAAQPTIMLFGAGHVSCQIARLARSVHFRVFVCDDRTHYANRARFPEADEIIVEDFGRVFDRIAIDADSYIVIVTRGHRQDRIVLERALRTDARYIGMIGSRRKARALQETLENEGVPRDLFRKVYSPIGLSIGAVTAEEIALSIVAELVKVRRLGDEQPVSHMSLSRVGGAP